MRHHQPSGLRHGLPLLIDPDWSPEQVMAVIELLDDLRERIWSHYETVLLDPGGHINFLHLWPGQIPPGGMTGWEGFTRWRSLSQADWRLP